MLYIGVSLLDVEDFPRGNWGVDPPVNSEIIDIEKLSGTAL